MPDRLLRRDFGESPQETTLSTGALTAYPFITRAGDNFGCHRDNRGILRDKAFPGRSRPTIALISKWLEEYEATGLVELKDGWIYFTRWFKDNRFYGKLRPVAPMPAYMEPYMTEDQWGAADVVAFEEAIHKMGGGNGESRTVPYSPVQSGKVPSNLIKPNRIKPKEVYASGFPIDEFKKIYRECWKYAPSKEQGKRADTLWQQYGMKEMEAAMRFMGGKGHAFRWVGKKLKGEWRDAVGSADGKPGRHHVDED